MAHLFQNIQKRKDEGIYVTTKRQNGRVEKEAPTKVSIRVGFIKRENVMITEAMIKS